MKREGSPSSASHDHAVGLTDHELVISRFEFIAESRPDSIAVACIGEAGCGFEHQISYDWLNRLAKRIASRLAWRGIASESLVGIAVGHDLASVVSILSTMKAGACLLPLDGGLPDLRLKRIVQESGIETILVSQEKKARFSPLGAELVVVDDCFSEDAEEGGDFPRFAHPDNAAYAIYTSGSTGEPKGVVVTQRGLANHGKGFSEAIGLSSQDNVLQFNSLAFDFAYEEILPSLSCGARLVIRSAEMRQDVALLLLKCQEQQVTILDMPTAFWHLLTEMMRLGRLEFPAAVRWIAFGGEEASLEQAGYWAERFGNQVGLLNTYGPTEGTIFVSSCNLLDHVAFGRQGAPLGTSLPGTALELRDQNGACEPEQIGEIHISGAGVARGYLNSPRLTAERFVPDAGASDGGRSYRTGDLAVVARSGHLLFKGRSDNQVKLNGHRIQLEEVENTLLSHPSIDSCAVLMRDNRLGGKHLVAYCVLHRDEEALPFEVSPLSVMTLRDFLRQRLPEYMLPGEFSFLEKFILTSGGKVDRTKLPEIGYFERKWRNLPEIQKPREGLEAELAGIWCDVLDLDINELSAEDPFEYLGGNSLYSIQVRFKAQQAGLLFKASDLHLRQTIRGLALCCQPRGSGLKRAQHRLVDYANYVRGFGQVMLKGLSRSMALGRSRIEKRNSRMVERFYGDLRDKEDIVYIFFTTNLLHWLSTTLEFVSPGYNIVLIGSGLKDEEATWVQRRFDRPFLQLEEEIDLDMIWDILFSVNQRNFGWLEVDCLVMNPSIFEEMRSIAADEAVNCVWTHAACGPTKRPFHVLESYFLFFNVAVIQELREAGVLPRPSAQSASLRQIELIKNLIPAEKNGRDQYATLGGGPFAHRLLNFDFARLVLFQLVANASGYKLNRIRFFTEIDTFNPYNYYSDEAIHPFPTIRYYDSHDWTGSEQVKRLAADYLLMIWLLDALPPCYQDRKRFLESKLESFEVSIDAVRASLRSYLEECGVTEKTFNRKEFGWMTCARPQSDEPSPAQIDRAAAAAS